MGINFTVRKFKNDVIDAINQKDLPIEIKRLCLSEIMQELSMVAERQVQEEIRQEQAMKEENKEIPTESESEGEDAESIQPD